MAVLVDANVLLDILTADPAWLAWSSDHISQARASGPLVINAVICAEIAPAFECDWVAIDQWLKPSQFVREAVPFEASVLAAEAHRTYRNQGGSKISTLPDFFIGAHAMVAGHRLLTRDAARYRTYFPGVTLISPP